MNTTTNWLDNEFMVLAKEAQWNNVAGIYIFAGVTPQNQWKAYYIGQADSFQNRIPSHEQWASARSLGATHVHALVVPLVANRDKLEASLIQAYQPPLNTQLK